MMFLYYFVMFFGLGTFSNYILIYLLDTTSFSEASLTFMMGFAPLVNLLATNLFAYLSDRHQKHKRILQIALFFSIVSIFLLLQISRWEIYLWLAISYYLLMFFTQAPGQLIENFAFEYGALHQISYGRLRLFGSLGYGIAGFLGGFLTETLGLNIIFYIYAISFVIPLFMVPSLPDISNKLAHKDHQENLYQTLFGIKEFKDILILSFLILGSLGVMATFFGIYITNYAHLDLKFFGLTILITAGTEIPMMFLSKQLIDKLGPYRLLSLASFLTFIRFLVYAFIPKPFWILLVSFTNGIGYGSSFTAIMYLIEKHIPKAIRSSAISINATVAVGFGTFLITGFGSTFLNARSIFILLAMFQVSASVYAFGLNQKTVKQNA